MLARVLPMARRLSPSNPVLSYCITPIRTRTRPARAAFFLRSKLLVASLCLPVVVSAQSQRQGGFDIVTGDVEHLADRKPREAR